MQTSATLKCVSKCGKNETFADCYSVCPLHCGQHIQCFAEECGGKCVCKQGFVLGPNGNCISEGDCPVTNNDS